MKEGEKGLVILLLLAGLFLSDSLKCPRYCSCFVSYNRGLKTVECISKQLINIDLGVPFEVQILDLSNNSISTLDDRGFHDLGLLDIEELYLRHNSIRSIGLHAFAGLLHLRHLDLSGNHLYHILPWSFHDNPSIKELILANNPIGHAASGSLLDVSSLEVLDVANCHFAHLPEEMFSLMQELQIVNVSGNQLIGVEIQVVAPLHMLRVIDISRNPWSCDTNMKQLEEWLHSRSVQLIGSSCDIDKHKKDTEEPKLEKMISLVEPYSSSSSEEDDLEKEWIENERHLNKSFNCSCEVYFNKSTSKKLGEEIQLKIPSPWIFVIGFQFGMLFTLFTAFIWVSWKRPKRIVDGPPIAEEIQPIIMIEPPCPDHPPPECPETPPPSYRDLFYV